MGKRKRVRREEGWKNRRVVTLMVSGMVRKWGIAAATAVRLFFFFLLRQKRTLLLFLRRPTEKSEEEAAATTTQLWHYMKRHTQENSSSSSRLKEYYIVVNLWRAVSDGDSGGLYFQVCAAVLPYLDGFPKQRLMKLCSSRRVGLEGATQCISIHLSAYALF